MSATQSVRTRQPPEPGLVVELDGQVRARPVDLRLHHARYLFRLVQLTIGECDTNRVAEHRAAHCRAFGGGAPGGVLLGHQPAAVVDTSKLAHDPGYVEHTVAELGENACFQRAVEIRYLSAVQPPQDVGVDVLHVHVSDALSVPSDRGNRVTA